MLPASATPAQPLSDQDLAAAVCARMPGAFEMLMRRYNRVLFRAARSILRDDTEAQDVLQETYLQAYRHLHAFRGDATLRTWLTRIVVNEAIARSRKLARRAEVIDLHASGDEQDQGASMQDQPSHDGPEQQAQRAQFRLLLERQIDRLPESFRTVFMLRAVEELGAQEVAAILDIPEATVRTRFFRARSMLREALQREFDFAVEDAFGFDGARCDRIVAGTLAALARDGQGDA
ncbi:RNA polymerase sigma factor [Pseudoduganella sp. GCM10020061]|uniref:RNA polymerase sigma factor n=1 Tax=Pseudoduganella sp. GCM10020061 TaxID=3317345 RepID=UPI00364373DF